MIILMTRRGWCDDKLVIVVTLVIIHLYSPLFICLIRLFSCSLFHRCNAFCSRLLISWPCVPMIQWSGQITSWNLPFTSSCLVYVWQYSYRFISTGHHIFSTTSLLDIIVYGFGCSFVLLLIQNRLNAICSLWCVSRVMKISSILFILDL